MAKQNCSNLVNVNLCALVKRVYDVLCNRGHHVSLSFFNIVCYISIFSVRMVVVLTEEKLHITIFIFVLSLNCTYNNIILAQTYDNDI